MTNSQNVANFGFNPPQNNSQAIKMDLPDDSKQTHFANLCLQGNESKKNDLKQGKNEAKKGPLQAGNENVTFWTACSYCYYKYEYEKKFEECCLRCQSCRKPFHAVAVSRPVLEGLSVKGYSGNSSMVVEISDSDDDEKKEEVKAQGFNDGKGRVVNVMADKFSFANFGFNPPQNNVQNIQMNHFLKTGFDGNEFKSRKNAVKKGPLGTGNEKCTFWTACSYCYYKYKYEKKYQECYMRCQNCRKAFHAVAVAVAKGLSVKGHSGNSSMSQEKIRRRNTAKRHDVVEIPDSDDEKKERVMKRVKSVARTTKKIAGRGLKTKKVENEAAGGFNEDELELFEGVNDGFVDLRDN